MQFVSVAFLFSRQMPQQLLNVITACFIVLGRFQQSDVKALLVLRCGEKRLIYSTQEFL